MIIMNGENGILFCSMIVLGLLLHYTRTNIIPSLQTYCTQIHIISMMIVIANSCMYRVHQITTAILNANN